jgi:hypothetical protein
VAFYRFDESKVPDYYLQMNQTKLQSIVDTEAYPKAGVDNPLVDVLTYDVASKRVVKLDVRDGQPFADPAIGYYVYHVAWTADSSEVIFDRANRRRRTGCLQSRLRQVPRRGQGIVARKLGGNFSCHAFPGGRQDLHLDLRTQRLRQPLSVRSHRQTPRRADVASV